MAILGLSAMLPGLEAGAAPTSTVIHGTVHAPISFLDTRGVATSKAPLRSASPVSMGCINNDCATPDAHLSYWSGAILTTPTVYFVRFSNSASSLSPLTGFISQVFASYSLGSQSGAGALRAALSGGYIATQNQYGASSSFHAPVFGGVVTLYAPALANSPTISDTQISGALGCAMVPSSCGTPVVATSDSAVPSSWDAQTIFVVVPRYGQVVTADGFDSLTTFCGYHSWVTDPRSNPVFPYVVVPNEQANPGCFFTGGLATAFDNMTPVLSHELAETVTDPFGNGWHDAFGGENGDLCEGTGTISGLVHGVDANYSLQFLWSNEINACLSGQVTTSLVAHVVTNRMVTATLTSSGVPLTSAPLTMTSGASTVATGTTNASGVASFSIPDMAAGTVLGVSYAATNSATAATASVVMTKSVSTITASMSGSNQVNATLTANGVAVPRATLNVYSGATLVGTGITNSAGAVAIFTSAIPQYSWVLVSYAGSATVGGTGIGIMVPIPSGLYAGQTLFSGQVLLSPNGRYRFSVQTDGNLTIAGPMGYVWKSNTSGVGLYLKSEMNGNLVLYRPGGTPTAVWSTGTTGMGIWRTTLTNAGVLVSIGTPTLTSPTGLHWLSWIVWGTGVVVH